MLLSTILSQLVSLSSFLSGIVFGVFLCIAALVHVLKSKPEDTDAVAVAAKSGSLRPTQSSIQNMLDPSFLSASEVAALRELVQFLDDFNSPLKNFGGHLEQVYVERDAALKEAERHRGVPLEQSEFARIERDFHGSIAELRDQSKCAKTIAQFLTDLSKVVLSFAKDLNKLSGAARSNSNRCASNNATTGGDTKADMVASNWWQALHIALDCMSSDQEYLSNHITDDLLNYSAQMSEELAVIEKKLQAEGSRQLQAMKELLALLEARKRDRDRYMDKIAAPPSALTTQTPEAVLAKRRVRQKNNEDAVALQRGLVLDAQRDFHLLMTRIRADVQLTVLKAVVDQHAQLMKLCEALERQQSSYQMIFKRMRIQLSNAAASLVQMIREEGTSNAATGAAVHDQSSTNAVTAALDYMSILRGKMQEVGVQGYEVKLHAILGELLRLSTSTQFQLEMMQTTPASLQAHPQAGSTARPAPRELGRLDMMEESTSCLAASNPAVLPHLPPSFLGAVGTETCVWFNSFSGRVYRDISNSNYFYHWFCRKASAMLNKGHRPDFVDEFRVEGVRFGKLPPLLLNVRWSPQLSASSMSEKKKVGGKTKDDDAATAAGTEDSDDTDQEEGSTRRTSSQHRTTSGAADLEAEHYAACTADLAFRSGIEFTVTTKLWINWPRDRYASVPVTLHLHLAECSGPIRFGVQRSHSFFSFVGDPVMRINVRNEIGKGVFHLKDLPQISDFVVKKLKAFVHRKIVHPNCHKFRLIWPRHWWPEGTEDCFMDAAAAAASQPNNSQKHQEEPISATAEPDRNNTSNGSSPDNCPSPSDNAAAAAAVTSGPDSTTTSSNSSSSYESMKHTVSTWLHKGKDRRQQQQQHRASLRGDATSSSSSSGDKLPEPDYSAQSAMATDITPQGVRRRKSASEKVKSLLHSYADPVKPRGTGTYRSLPLSFRNNNSERDCSETAAVISDGHEHEQRVSALLSPLSDRLKDSAAWDMAVKSISMKYIELQRAGAGRDGTSHDSFFLVRSAPPDSSSSSSMTTGKSVFVLPAMPDSVRRSAERSLPLLRVESKSAHPWSDSRGSEDDSRLIYHPDFSSGRKVSRRHSFDVRRDAPSSADRCIILRSTSLSDLRPDVCEAMFRLHVVSSRYAIAEAAGDSSEECENSSSSREAVSLDSRHAINQFMDCAVSDEHSVDELSLRSSCTTPRPVQSKIAIVKSKFANFKAKHIRSSSESSSDTTGGTTEGKLSISTGSISTPTEDHEKNAAVPGGAMRYLSAMFRSSTPGK